MKRRRGGQALGGQPWDWGVWAVAETRSQADGPPRRAAFLAAARIGKRGPVMVAWRKVRSPDKAEGLLDLPDEFVPPRDSNVPARRRAHLARALATGRSEVARRGGVELLESAAELRPAPAGVMELLAALAAAEPSRSADGPTRQAPRPPRHAVDAALEAEARSGVADYLLARLRADGFTRRILPPVELPEGWADGLTCAGLEVSITIETLRDD